MDLISVLISEPNYTNMSLLLVARKADKQIDSEPDRDSERQRQRHRRESVKRVSTEQGRKIKRN